LVYLVYIGINLLITCQ